MDDPHSSELIDGNFPDPTSGEAVFERRYGKDALTVARCVLLAHASGKLIKKRDVAEAIQKPTREVGKYIRAANAYLSENLGMQIVEPKVSETSSGQVLARDHGELAIVSESHAYRSILRKVRPKHQLRAWGVLCFVLILLVLEEEPLSFSDLLDAFQRSQLHLEIIDTSENANLQESAEPFLREVLAQYVQLRVLETSVKQTHSSTGQGYHGASGGQTQAIDSDAYTLYHIGPYSRELISGNELYQLIIKVHFPTESRDAESFLKKYGVETKIIRQRINSSGLKPITTA